MMTPMRYVVLVLTIIISLHFILTFSHEAYGNATSISKLISQQPAVAGSSERVTPSEYIWHDDTTAIQDRRANAAIVMLARNSDLKGITKSMKQMEDRFNKKFKYPYVFLNEEPFNEQFISTISELTDAKVEFGLIPHDHWFQPDWIDEEKASASRAEMAKNNVIYGGSLPYRNMCRFNSGFFYRHELLAKYKYYWRVEPDVTFFCDLDYDPFLVMQDQEKVYGFTISLPEYGETITTLWDTVKDFIEKNPELIPGDNGMGFLSDDNGLTYNRCHFWSNFEIGDLDFWRGEAYGKFFDHLDQAGGFYYERWGDAPVHSIGAALLAPKDKLHFFSDIGYRHEPFQRCPQGEAHSRGKCWCDAKENFDYEWYSCLPKFDRLFN
ncbi:glycosyltransferase family 15 protein [Stereum hirsutum FP-91666 SS1]|uniref:glycosyltransferase family 15 protein n=1 Tax=Stereum hirsutum (strain FP-91666) TaxID=721885 RepID=UPI000440E63E|nr:glycosyltransferase family 15 protein [Stereum hirsutum FP-91666 SS1]EIM90058.1 glycosyltransferase family 15 protein [Stereum hirsutum FP-91666 SS1]